MCSKYLHSALVSNECLGDCNDKNQHCRKPEFIPKPPLTVPAEVSPIQYNLHQRGEQNGSTTFRF
jgi:hypothetical protein